MAQDVRSQLMHGVIWNFIEKVLMRGASFLIGIVLARLLAPSDFGLIGMLTVFIAISNVFIEGGLSKALIQRQSCKEIDYSTAFVVNVLISFVIYLILFLLAPWIAEFYNEPLLVDLTRVLSINFVIGSLNVVQRAKLTAIVDFKSLAQINIISTFIGGGSGIILAYTGIGVWALVFQQIVTTTTSFFLFPLYSKWKPSIRFSLDSFRFLFGYGSKIVATGTVAVIMNNISLICIGKFYKSSQLGFYTNSLRISDILSSTINDVLGNVTFPVLSELQDNRNKLSNVYKKSLFLTAFAVFPLMTICALLARPFILLLFTEKWLPCVALLQWLLMARIVFPLSAINLNLLNAIGRPDLFMKTDFSKIPMNILSLAITIPLGVEAIAIGLFVTSYIAFFINSYYPGKLIGYGALSQLYDWRYIFISTGIMALVVSLFKYFISDEWIQLLCGGIIAVTVYLICCYLFKIIDDDMLRMLKLKKL